MIEELPGVVHACYRACYDRVVPYLLPHDVDGDRRAHLTADMAPA